jgi:hypothetical protein
VHSLAALALVAAETMPGQAALLAWLRENGLRLAVMEASGAPGSVFKWSLVFATGGNPVRTPVGD